MVPHAVSNVTKSKCDPKPVTCQQSLNSRNWHLMQKSQNFGIFCYSEKFLGRQFSSFSHILAL